jgi:tetratricopeptide (TPR) repeat protein
MHARRQLIRLILAALVAAAPRARAAGESLVETRLKTIVEEQRTVLAEAAAQRDRGRLDDQEFRIQVEKICHEYESLLQDSPKFAAGYASYGYLLWKVGMRKEAAAILLKANEIDPDIALVKNELGNYLAEEGQPLDAVSYFLSAIKLEPKEPLYHYQLGTLLYEARDDFIRSGEWTREAIDHAMHEAFRNAAELAPDRVEFGYRYAESFYDLDNPDWNEAFKAWTRLEAKAQSDLERQTMRLHEANVSLKQGKADRAREILATVTAPELQGQKKKLVDGLAGGAAK